MLPVIVRIPALGVTIWSYGLMLAVAFGTGLLLIRRFARRDGLPEERVYSLGLVMIPSALLGAKAMARFDSGLAGSPGAGSGSYLGGFLMAVAVSTAIAGLWHLPWRRTADAFAPALAFGYGIARLGCFLAGCCWGRRTDAWFGMRFSLEAHALTGTPIDHRLVPTQLIEAVLSLVTSAGLLTLRKRRSFDGQIILAYVLCYSVARFCVEYWRDDPRGSLGALSLAQFVSVILFAAASSVLALASRAGMQRCETTTFLGIPPAALKK